MHIFLIAQQLFLLISMLAMPPRAADAQGSPPSKAPPDRPIPATVHIIHGYSASPSDHWFPWLKHELEADGHSVVVHRMPDSANPDVDAWRQTLRQTIPPPGRRTFFVAHSLGCISLLHYVSELPERTSIGGLVLVSGFSQPIASLPELDAFTADDLPFDRIRARASQRAVIASENDPIVPFGHTVHLQQMLEARLITVQAGGHFLASDGYTEHPPVLEALKRMVKTSDPAPDESKTNR